MNTLGDLVLIPLRARTATVHWNWGTPLPWDRAGSFQFATSPGIPHPLLLLFPTYSPIPLPARQREKGCWHVWRRGQAAEAPRAWGSKVPSTSCAPRGLFCYFPFVPAHASPVTCVHPQRLSRLALGLGVRPKLYNRQERTGQGSPVPIQCL